MTHWHAASLASLTLEQRAQFLGSLSNQEARALYYDWLFWARPDQLAPLGDWLVWLLLAGRGFGKTKSGAEWVIERARTGFRRIAVIGQTKGDVRDTMIEVGDSALLNISPPWFRPIYEPSKRRLTWPNGCIGIVYSGDEPGQLRGPQHDCLIAGTNILTPSGESPIEDLRVGDLVMTRRGIRRITATRNLMAEAGRITFSDSRELIGTATHPVLVAGGWKSLADLTKGEGVCTGERLRTGIWQHTRDTKRSISTDGFGSNITERSRQAFMCITRTATRKTIRSPILSLWNRSRIGACTMPLQRRFLSNAKIAELRSSGLGRIAAPLCVNDASAAEPRRRERHCGDASIVGENSSLARAFSVARVVSTWEPVGRIRVYDITVEEDHEYLANGIFVHNSAWVDELAKFKYPQETWDNLEFGLRIGRKPQVVVTTTPKPIPIIKALLEDPEVVATRGSTYDNIANLSPVFVRRILKRYEGTRLGRQEIHAELLDDNPGALWRRDAMIECYRVTRAPSVERIVVAVDPPGTSTGAEAGIVVAGKAGDHGYVFDDRSRQGTPAEWAQAAVTAYNVWEADRVIGEVNNGGDMVEHTIHTVDTTVSYKAVRASRGKYIRAEPIAALYEQGRVHHVGTFGELEDQMCQWVPGDKSPDRLDALVWALTELMLGDSGEPGQLERDTIEMW